MTDEQVTQLSALIDGELTSHTCVPLQQALAGDPGLRATWERYHLIGQALRGEPVDREVCAVAAAVRERLGAELIRSRPRVVSARARLWRAPFAGAALAAAAAFLAVFAVPGLYRGVASTPATAKAPTAAGATPTTIPARRRWETDRDDLVGKLDLFLVSHQEAVPLSGVQGMLPYAALVGYEAGR